ncbi:hypothetical protein LOZ53_000367 [Ophidiomyces ophidiicola]|nr:hypothetical protein LOZ55_002155 [Ophidiomyces ophidiicola]KAI1992198.1 hypothetical protein LOZ54_001814 [Ophidiomyces ophidiicola]KAI1993539.1 hypothetical protein LOZ51_003918 [Ophidiomyces ophidiicola]KAI1997549.1 hypothetical protein LOZ53_000367 [Ophidiomyces ophidiicola]
MKIYTLDGAINAFFSAQISPTRQECDDLAAEIVRGPVYPLSIQGCFSYTVSTNGDEENKIVQFRVSHSPLDVGIIQLAQEIHGDVVPPTQYYGEVGSGPTAPLQIYIIKKLSGITCIDMVLQYQRNPSCSMPKLRIIQDLSRYFASAWLHPQDVPQAKRKENQEQISKKPFVLNSALPPRYCTLISSLQADLHQLYSPIYPQVLTHGDLNARNTLVMPVTGQISGLVDWAEASILPFGMGLYGLKIMLGNMDSQG